MQQLLHEAPGHAEAMLQAGDLCDQLGDTAHAVEWFTRLLTKAPHDSGVLSRLGALHAKLGDEAEALACHTEAHAADRTNLDTLSWLGAHYVRRQDYVGAIPYFEAAARVQPRESKWLLMVAGCLRRVGRLEDALLQYREVYRLAPANMEALRYLAQLSQEFGLQEDAAKFGSEMARLERMQAAAAAAPAPAAPAGRITAQRPPTSGGRMGPLPTLPPPTAASPTAQQQQRRTSGMFAAAGATLRPPTRGA
jgi:intraflagellar transport protein 88